METKEFEVTEERAIKMLSANASVPKTGVPYNGVEVRNVSYINPETDMPWSYEDEDGNITGEYAIVNLKAQTLHHQSESLRLFQEGEYRDAVNKNVSINVAPDKAADIEAVGIGTLTMGTALSRNEELVDEEGNPMEIMVAKRFIPAKAVESKAVDFGALLAKAAEKAANGTPNEGDA